MLEQILELNRQAAARGEYEVAYHLLMAALHCIDDSGDPSALDPLAALARDQGQQVESVQPPHHLARRQARSRGQTALYDSFQAHVDAVRLRMQSSRHQR